MRQVFITKAGAPEVLKVQESPDPEAGAGQVRVRVKASGINFADLMARQGLYPGMPKIPCVIGYEASGLIDQVGAGVTKLKVGDRVLAMPKFGGYSDTLVVPDTQAFLMPAAMTFEEAAALPVNYLTAHHAMLQIHNLQRGSKILLHSAAGGVGVAAIQLAKLRDCVVFGTASPGKHEFLRSLGVQHPIDSGGDIEAAVRAVIGKDGGLDMVLDPLGGPSWTMGYRLLGPAGHLVCFGFSGAASGKTLSWLHVIGQFLRIKRYSPLQLMNDNKTVSGVNMAAYFDRIELVTPEFEALIAMYERGEIKPHVDKTFSFADAPAAHHYLHERKAKGKVLLVP